MFPDFAKGNQNTCYMFRDFKNIQLLDLIMCKVGEGNRAECVASNSDVSERSAGKNTLGRGSKQWGTTDNGLMEVAQTIVKPVEIQLT